jgi:hypothetical protein
MTGQDPLLDKLRDEVARDLRPVRPLRPAWLRALLLLPWSLLAVAALGAVYRTPWPWRVGGLPWLLAVTQAVAAYALLWTALRDAEPGRGPSGLALGLATTGAVAVPLGVYLFLLSAHPRDLPRSLYGVGLECFSAEVAIGLTLTAAGLWLAFRGLPLRPGLSGTLAGLAAGVGALAVWTLFCPFTSLSHVLPSHAGPLAVLAVAGLALGIAAARRRRR